MNNDGRRVVVKAKRAFTSNITCTVNGRPVKVTVSRDVVGLFDAECVVESSFGPGAKNLRIENVVIEKSY